MPSTTPSAWWQAADRRRRAAAITAAAAGVAVAIGATLFVVGGRGTVAEVAGAASTAVETTTGTSRTTTTSASTTTTSTTASASSSSTSTSSSTTTTTEPEDLLPTLREGDTGPEVLELQRMLNAVTNADIAPDGRYGPATVEAVTKFQRFVGLPETGEADHATRSLLIAANGGDSVAEASWPIPTIGDGGADGCQVSMIGDSLMAGAMPLHAQQLNAIGCAAAVDAVPGRSLSFGWQCLVGSSDGGRRWRILPEPEPDNGTCSPSGLEVFQLWSEAQALGDVVVVALGTNDAGLYAADAWHTHWQQALDLAGGRPVVFVTSQARPGDTRAGVQARYSEALRRWCGPIERCVVADWAFAPAALDPASYVDSVHLGSAATRTRAAFLATVVSALVTGRPIPNPTPLPAVTTTLPTLTPTSTTGAPTTASPSTAPPSTSTTTPVTTAAPATSTSTSTSTTSAPATSSTSSTTSTSTTVAASPPGSTPG